MLWAPLLLLLFAPRADPLVVLESAFSKRDFDLNTDPRAKEWAKAPRVVMNRDYLGHSIPGPPTEVRSRWTRDNLYLLYICPISPELNLKPSPDTSRETPSLWDWDVAEAFLGSDAGHIALYKEFEVSPQGEWVDLAIDREHRDTQQGIAWDSGFHVQSRIDRHSNVWFGAMRIPFDTIDSRKPAAGNELRLGLYRISGADPRQFYAWRPTGQTSFHVPEAFGTLRLRK